MTKKIAAQFIVRYNLINLIEFLWFNFIARRRMRRRFLSLSPHFEVMMIWAGATLFIVIKQLHQGALPAVSLRLDRGLLFNETACSRGGESLRGLRTRLFFFFILTADAVDVGIIGLSLSQVEADLVQRLIPLMIVDPLRARALLQVVRLLEAVG